MPKYKSNFPCSLCSFTQTCTGVTRDLYHCGWYTSIDLIYLPHIVNETLCENPHRYFEQSCAIFMFVYLVFLLSHLELFHQAVLASLNLWWPLEWRTSLHSIIGCGTIWPSQYEKWLYSVSLILTEKLLQQSEDNEPLKQGNVLPENLTCRKD